MADLEKIVEQLSSLSVLEAADLVKKLEEKWGVSAAAPVAVAAVGGAPAAAAEAVEEKTEFDVVIKDAGPKKIEVIKVIRQLVNLKSHRGEGTGRDRGRQGHGCSRQGCRHGRQEEVGRSRRRRRSQVVFRPLSLKDDPILGSSFSFFDPLPFTYWRGSLLTLTSKWLYWY